jgi:TatA/E family protein of Tat protein translocase
MFGLGMGELLVILVIALLFLGPKKLPEVASSLGKAIRSFRKATSDLTDQLEIDDSVKAPIRELKAALRDEPAPHQLAVQKPIAAAQSQPKDPPKSDAPKAPPPPPTEKKA